MRATNSSWKRSRSLRPMRRKSPSVSRGRGERLRFPKWARSTVSSPSPKRSHTSSISGISGRCTWSPRNRRSVTLRKSFGGEVEVVLDAAVDLVGNLAGIAQANDFVTFALECRALQLVIEIDLEGFGDAAGLAVASRMTLE